MINFEELAKKAEEKVLESLSEKGYKFETNKDLQRTEEWFEQRRGRFTGSGIKSLMACNKATSKMEWGRPEKTIDFGETAKKYVYSKAKERQRGKVIITPGSAALRYGTENEQPVIDLVLEKFPEWEHKEVGFLEFIKDIAGASPDGKLLHKLGIQKAMGYEGKCATNWDTVYTRCEVAVDQKHQDFWQLQSEMMALKVDKLLYAVAEPSEDMFEPNITDVITIIVPASPIHQKEIRNRCLIGNAAIELFLKGMNMHSAIEKACTEFEV